MKATKYQRQEREFVLGSRLFTFDPDGTGRYRLPRYIINTKTPGAPCRDLKKEMKLGDISKNEQYFIDDLSKLSEDVLTERPIYQFPFLISNRELWKWCCDKSGITGPDDLAKMYFRFDIFYPAYNTVIEVDSAYHDVGWQSRLDSARDLYLQNVGNLRIKTLRCNPYLIYNSKLKRYIGKNTTKLEEIFKYLKTREMCCTGIRTYPHIDFTDYAISYMKEEYWKEEFKIIPDILGFLGIMDFKELCLDHGIKPKKTLKDSIEKIMLDIYGIKISV